MPDTIKIVTSPFLDPLDSITSQQLVTGADISSDSISSKADNSQQNVSDRSPQIASGGSLVLSGSVETEITESSLTVSSSLTTAQQQGGSTAIALSNEILGTSGNDTLTGTSGDDLIYGLDGDDRIQGGNGDDVLSGGAGRDWLTGGFGDDTYLYALGDGRVTISNEYSTNSYDRISFQEGISPDEVVVKRSRHNGNLEIVFKNHEGSIYIGNNFTGEFRSIDALEFADNTIWDAEEINRQSRMVTEGDDNIFGTDADEVFDGLAGNDYIDGGYGNDIIRGGEGRDTLDGGSGNDTLRGGAGRDTLEGGTGNDIYLWGLGDSDTTIDNYGSSTDFDTLKFLSGITPDDVILKRTSPYDSLEITFTNSEAVISINHHFSYSNHRLNQIEFDDGTVWDIDDIQERVLVATESNDYLIGTDADEVIDGLAGNDRIEGGGGNDTLRGGAGRDTLEGGTGNDIYLWGLGDGNTTIDNYGSPNDIDTLKFLSGINPEDLILKRTSSYDSLEVHFINSEAVIRINYQFSSHDHYRLNQIQFEGDIVWDLNEINARVLIATEGDDYLVGSDKGEVLNGLAGDDRIEAGGGDDTLKGGLGRDFLKGGEGNDTYIHTLGDDETIIVNDRIKHDIDTLKLSNISAEDVILRMTRFDDLSIEVMNSDDQITISDYFVGFDQVVDIVFDDQTTWNRVTVLEQILEGSDGDDYLIGTDADEVINGLAGDDNIDGGAGNDTLRGGTGRDSLKGGAGNDTYIHALGDGETIIEDYYSDDADTLKLTGIAAENVVLQRDYSRLVISTLNSDDKITINSYFSGSDQVAAIEFDDLTVWDSAAIQAKVLKGTEGDDYLIGTDADDVINGLAGDDHIEGGDGNDTLRGGEGSDALNGGAGNDTYIHALGDGETIIEDYYSDDADSLKLTGISVDDVVLSRSGYSDLSIDILNSTDQITVENYYTGSDQISSILFDDQTIWDASYIELNGNNYAPEVVGYLEDQTITVGHEFTIEIPSDVFADQDTDQELTYTFSIVGGPLVFDWVNFDNETLSLSGVPLAGSVDQAEIVVTATDPFGLSVDSSFSLKIVPDYQLISGTNDPETLNGSELADQIVGLAGDDRLYGRDGRDWLQGGFGNDRLFGGVGADLIVGGVGNDFLSGGDGNDIFQVLPDVKNGFDRVNAGKGQDLLLGSGNDDEIGLSNLFAEDSLELIDGGRGFNFIKGTGTGNILDFSQTELINIAYIDAAAGPDRVIGSQGNDGINGGIGNDIINGLGGDDYLLGSSGRDKIDGGEGNDWIIGGTGNDLLSGGAGDDLFFISPLSIEESGFDKYAGGEGIDTIASIFSPSVEGDSYEIGLSSFTTKDSVEVIQGSDYLSTTINGHDRKNILDFSATELLNIDYIDGAAGNDKITGSAGDDVIIGGLGDDTLHGGDGDDTFIYTNGDGADFITGGNGVDTLKASAEDDQIVLKSHAAASGLEVIDGGEGNNSIAGTDKANRLDFQNSELRNIDFIDGKAGTDIITGSAGDDLIIGGRDNDRLYGGLGSDQYLFNLGDGKDTISEHRGENEEDVDHIAFNDLEQIDSLWFSRNASNLVINVVGQDDKVTVQNWYKGDRFQIEQIEIQGSVLGNDSVDALVQAMAAFDVPTGAGGVISDEVRSQLQPVLAASWQAS